MIKTRGIFRSMLDSMIAARERQAARYIRQTLAICDNDVKLTRDAKRK